MQLGGLTAMAKAQAGIVLDECARCAVLLFGGNGFMTTGKGEIAERIYRDVPGARIQVVQKTCCWIWQYGSSSRITGIRPSL